MTQQLNGNTGLDQWGVLQGMLNGADPHVVLNGQVLISRTLAITKPGSTLTGLNGPLVDGIQAINDSGPAFITNVFRPDDLLQGGDWYMPRSIRMERTPTTTSGIPTLPWVISVQNQHQREHIDIRRTSSTVSADNVAVSDIFVRGTKRVAGRSMTWKYDPSTGITGSERNHLEAQTGIDVHGVNNCTITDVDIFGVWGDLAGANPFGSGASNVNSQFVTFDGGNWDLAGRHAMGCNGTNHFQWLNTNVSRHVSDLYHVEATTSNHLIDQDDHLIQDVTDDEALDAVHVRTGNAMDDVTARRIHITTGEFRCTVANAAGTGVRMSNYLIDDCDWTVRIDNTGELAQITNVDGFTVINCSGPMQTGTPLVSATTSSGINATFANNPGITLVP